MLSYRNWNYSSYPRISFPIFPWYQKKIDKVFGKYRSPGIGAMDFQLIGTEGHFLKRILRRVHSPNLRWLYWSDCPYSYLPSWIPMKNLRFLKVSGGALETLWQGKSQVNLGKFAGSFAIDIALQVSNELYGFSHENHPYIYTFFLQ